MTYGIIVNAPMPIEMYRAVHDAVDQKLGNSAPTGLLAHIARPTPEGFQIIELWESKEICDEFQDAILAPIIDSVSGGQAPGRAELTTEFEVENFIVGSNAMAAASH